MLVCAWTRRPFVQQPQTNQRDLSNHESMGTRHDYSICVVEIQEMKKKYFNDCSMPEGKKNKMKNKVRVRS